MSDQKEPPKTFDRFHQTRVTPRTILVFFLVLAALYLLFDRTDLWYVLFPD